MFFDGLLNKIFILPFQKLRKNVGVQESCQHPVVERDLTILAKIDVDFSYIESVFENINYLIEKECSYIYEGDKIEAGMKAVTFKLKFLDEEKTLKGTEVDESVEAIIKNINDKKLEFKSL